MLSYFWAPPALSPRQTRTVLATVSLSSAVYCAGDLVQGTVELHCDDDIDAVSRSQHLQSAVHSLPSFYQHTSALALITLASVAPTL